MKNTTECTYFVYFYTQIQKSLGDENFVVDHNGRKGRTFPIPFSGLSGNLHSCTGFHIDTSSNLIHKIRRIKTRLIETKTTFTQKFHFVEFITLTGTGFQKIKQFSILLAFFLAHLFKHNYSW